MRMNTIKHVTIVFAAAALVAILMGAALWMTLTGF